MKKIRFILGIIIILITLYSYKNMFTDFVYFQNVINKFTLIGNLLIGIGLILFSLDKIKSKYYIHLLLISWLIFIVVVGIFQYGLLGEGWLGFILHYLIPLILLIDFLFLEKSYIPKYKDSFGVILIPLMYLIYVLIYGGLTSNYPYSFLDLTRITIYEMALTIFILLLVYLLLGLLFINIKIKLVLINKSK